MVELAPPRRGEVNYNMWYVYILKSLKDEKYYIGCTDNLERRIDQHNRGENSSTRFRRPFELIYTETYANSSIAYSREKKIKRYKGGNTFRKLISK